MKLATYNSFIQSPRSDLLPLNASLALDFSRGYYRLGNGPIVKDPTLIPGLTHSRSGAEQLSYNPVTGKWQIFAANAMATMLNVGFDAAEGTTNKFQNFNASPTTTTGINTSGISSGVLTVVDDVAELVAAGFGDLIAAGKMNGKVFKLDNSAGGTNSVLALLGGTGNTAQNVFSLFFRGSWAGTGLTIGLSGNGGSNKNLAAQSRYTRAATVPFQPASDTFAFIQLAAGGVLYFILNQLEEKAYATNPTIIAGATATRGNALPIITGLASILTPPFTLVAVANLSAIDGVDRDLVDLSATGINSDSMYLVRNLANTALFAMTTGGAVQASATFPNKAGPRLLKMAWRVRATTATPAVDGVLGSPATVTPPPLAILTLGSRLGNNRFLKSPLLFVGVFSDLSDSQLQAITSSSGGALMDFT